jgi:2-polyprenyl-3-methyl-5-hydroxy-6-metoxy-1,4-benzoquinol methylase
MNDRIEQHSNLTFDDFCELAKKKDISKFEKIGFPDDFRCGKEESIFSDINNKVQIAPESIVLDIGAGCSDLPEIIATYCDTIKSKYVVIDSKEMLENISDSFECVEKISGFYPDIPAVFSKYKGKVDVIICYSVFQYIFEESNAWRFIDATLSLLKPGGRFLIGDIPNASMRKRFLESEAGISFHQQYMNTQDLPNVRYNCLEPGDIDDSVVFSIVSRCRNQGFHAYILPQSSSLPMSNRREDILIIRP